MRAIILAIILAGLAIQPAHADPSDVAATIAVIYERAAAHGQSGAAMERLAMCESHGETSAVGRAGEIGLYQLASFGLLPLFYQRGYTDPWDAYQQADFTAWALSQNMGRHWSCWRR